MTEAVVLACNWLVDLIQWYQHFRRCTAWAMQSVLHGHASRVHEPDRAIEAFNNIAKCLSCTALPGTHLVEF